MSWFRRNRARLVVAGLLLFDLFLFVAHLKDSKNKNWLDRALLWISSPIQDAAIWAIDGTVSIWTDYIFLVGLRDENQVLREQLDDLRRKLERLESLDSENQRLRELVRMRGRLEQSRLVAARVVGVGTSPVSRIVRIDVGRDDGVEVGSAVVAGSGLVGRVLATVGGYAEVQLIVDGRSAVDVVFQRSRARGIVRGRGEDELCSVDHLVRTADVQVGDKAVTSGMGGIYPRGLLVGTISRATSPAVGVFREADLQPVVAFQSLEEVLVVLRSVSPAEQEQDH